VSDILPRYNTLSGSKARTTFGQDRRDTSCMDCGVVPDEHLGGKGLKGKMADLFRVRSDLESNYY